jgi:putative heme-binding domain-containing protein
MLLAPGDPDRSVLVHRLARRGRSQMPPLVTRRVDSIAVELMRTWIAGLHSERTIVKQWTMDDLVAELPGAADDRAIESGQAAFRMTGCAECHRFAGEGGTVGPDLTGLEKRLKAPEVLESILVPSKVIAPEYASYAIETDDGRVVAGRIEREDDDVLVIRPNATTATAPRTDQRTISKASIVARRRMPVSNMPEGIVNVLQKDEVLDLVAYLMSGRVEESAASR